MSGNDELNIDAESIQEPSMLTLALVGGLAASILGAFIWAAVTVATEFQIGFMAVGMGFLVGFTVRYLGQGTTSPFRIYGAIISLFGCFLGNFFSQLGFSAQNSGESIVEVWTYLDFALIPSIIAESFHPLDALFYVIALYEGYRFSAHKPPEKILTPLPDSNHLQSSYPQVKKIVAGIALVFVISLLTVALYLPNREVSVQYPSSDVTQWRGSIRWGQPHGLWNYWSPDGTQQATITWKMGLREGPAEFYHFNGTLSSEENYLHGLLHGPAKAYRENGQLLSAGEYSYGRMSGFWKTYDETGQSLSEGSYHLDRPTGQWTFWHPAGTLASRGQFEMGAIIGDWEYYYESGEPQRISEYDSEGRERILRSWSPDGNIEVRDGNGYYRFRGDKPGVVLLEGPVKNGEMVQTWISRYPDGSIQQEIHWRDKEQYIFSAWDPDGNQIVTNGSGRYIQYHSSGNKISEAHFDNGRISGEQTVYFPSGEIRSSINFENGITNGKIIYYFISGQVEAEGLMEDGERVGEWTWWHEDGSKFTSVKYETGKKEGDQMFWEYGELIKIESYENGELIETILM